MTWTTLLPTTKLMSPQGYHSWIFCPHYGTNFKRTLKVHALLDCSSQIYNHSSHDRNLIGFLSLYLQNCNFTFCGKLFLTAPTTTTWKFGVPSTKCFFPFSTTKPRPFQRGVCPRRTLADDWSSLHWIIPKSGTGNPKSTSRCWKSPLVSSANLREIQPNR